MSDSSEDEELDLAALAKHLVLEGMPSQIVMGNEAGVSQSTVSRAINRRIKGTSAGALKLWKYAADRLAVLDVSEAQAASSGSRKGRSPSIKRRRTEIHDIGNSNAERRRLAEAAMSGLRNYLADAFDPQLIIEQLAVLRRAQDPARHRWRSDSSSPK